MSDDIIAIAPQTMANLTKSFIENKNVNDRVSLRLRMKAVLDYLSTDTEFPPNPLLKKDPAATPARDAAMGMMPQIGMGNGAFAQQNWPVVQALGPVEPIPAAQRMDNTEILG
jgi:hypothetical protein